MKIIAIAAMSKNRVLGANNSLPWRIPEDMEYFRQMTKGQIVLMGRKTFDSIPAKQSPLPNRKNIVITRSTSWSAPEEVEVYHDPLDAIKQIKTEYPQAEQLWIIGGGEIYAQTLPTWDEIYLTLVHKTVDGDTFFPKFETQFKEVSCQDRDGYAFIHYIRA